MVDQVPSASLAPSPAGEQREDITGGAGFSKAPKQSLPLSGCLGLRD